ncbi:MAG TPA: hypothetical protein VLX92_01840 [Kofleriaceae bacterium]|nr:hypothetical protein [Kofleriaceae bacterium]
MLRTSLLLIAGVATLVLTPVAPWHEDYAFGNAEVRAAIVGTWQLSTTDGHTITLAIEEADAPEHASRGWIAPAAACGSRSLVREAGACKDVTVVPLAITVLAGLDRSAAATGRLVIVGTTFRAGELDLALDALHVEAMLAPDGVATPTGTDITRIVRTR